MSQPCSSILVVDWYILREATDPSKQLYTQLELCKEGKLDIAAYTELALRFKDIGEKEVAKELHRNI